MDHEEALKTVSELVVSTTQAKRLSGLQQEIVRKAWDGMTYKDIADICGYTEQHVKKEGCQLWQTLSDTLGQTISKKNFRAKLEEIHGLTFPTPPESPERIYNNLPAPDHTGFIERYELARLMGLLRDPHIYRISIEGIGGVGKTTLALEAAYRCLEASHNTNAQLDIPRFQAIIFTSAKKQYLGTCRILPRIQRERTLRDIFRVIARTLDCLEGLPVDFTEQLDFIRYQLNRQRTLLIVDNLDTIEEQEYVLSFLLDNLPTQVKVVTTTRVQTILDATIRLESLPEKESLEMIHYQVKNRGVQLTELEAQQLYQTTCGIPVAIVYAIGRLAYGHSLDCVLTRLTMAIDDIAPYCFESSMNLLRGQLAHKLLMALALFPKPALKEAIAHVAVLATDSMATDDGLAQLQQLSLIKENKEGRYSMLPLTRTYVIAELEAYPDFEQRARERWVNWYLNFVHQNGTKDWKEWNQSLLLEKEWDNLQEAIEWCVANEKYGDFWEFWHYVKGYTHFLGYWDERLRWMDWLLQVAQQHQEWEMTAEALFDKGRTLTMMHQPQHQQEALQLFEEAWKLCKTHNLPCQYQIDVGVYIAIIQINQQRFEQAWYWLNQVEELLEQASLPEQEYGRLQTTLLYYKGKICVSSGEYDRAQIYYEQAHQQAQNIKWQRVVTYSQIWLADIAIKQGKLDTAEVFLKEGLPLVENYRDKRCLALCKRLLALLEQSKGELSQCRNWATQAREEFQNLGMLQEAAEMYTLLQN